MNNYIFFLVFLFFLIFFVLSYRYKHKNFQEKIKKEFSELFSYDELFDANITKNSLLETLIVLIKGHSKYDYKILLSYLIILNNSFKFLNLTMHEFKRLDEISKRLEKALETKHQNKGGNVIPINSFKKINVELDFDELLLDLESKKTVFVKYFRFIMTTILENKFNLSQDDLTKIKDLKSEIELCIHIYEKHLCVSMHDLNQVTNAFEVCVNRYEKN